MKQLRGLFLGGSGMLGQAMQRVADPRIEWEYPSHAQCDVSRDDWFSNLGSLETYNVIVNAAGVVGGIKYNIANQGYLLRANASIALNGWIGAPLHPKYIYIGSSCMYPIEKENYTEEMLGTGTLEATNEGYALAKLLGVKLAQISTHVDGVALIAPNLYGPNDNFNQETGHLIAGMMTRMVGLTQADPPFRIWGDGKQRREFMYVDDMARAINHFAVNWPKEKVLNTGVGHDHSVEDYAHAIAEVVNYHGDFEFERTMPVGMKKKLMDSSKAHALGWKPTVELMDGLERTYRSQFCATP